MSKINEIKYTIENDKVAKRIVLLADIHFYSKREKTHLDRVLKHLSGMEYDYLCISGDLLDKSTINDEELLIEWLTELGKLSKVIIGIGNHDVTSDRKTFEYSFNNELFAAVRKIKNVTVLDNEELVIGNIRFIGLTLPIDYYYQFKENTNYFMRYVNNEFPSAYTDKYNIMLCHTPKPFLDKKIVAKTRVLESIDLVLAGHMHGGVTPKIFRGLLRGRGLIGPGKNIFPKNAYGLVTGNKFNIVITSGVTTASHVNPLSFTDFMFMKEITVIDLVKKK